MCKLFKAAPLLSVIALSKSSTTSRDVLPGEPHVAWAGPSDEHYASVSQTRVRVRLSAGLEPIAPSA